MGDRLQVGKPSWYYVTSHPGQLSLAISPRVAAMSTSKRWDVNRHTARYTILVSVVWQCKLVFGWGLKKREISTALRALWLGKDFAVFYFTLRSIVATIDMQIAIPAWTLTGSWGDETVYDAVAVAAASTTSYVCHPLATDKSSQQSFNNTQFHVYRSQIERKMVQLQYNFRVTSSMKLQ